MEAYLREMKGIGASFMGAVLEKADLTYATFAGTSFQRASLGDANLTGATFAYADLTDVDLTDATLAFSRFKGANLSGVKFGDVDLIEDMGIEWTDVWAWSDNPPALPEHITEAIRLVYFDPQCRPGWEGRINTEIGYGEEAKLAAIRYRPPDDACLVNESTD